MKALMKSKLKFHDTLLSKKTYFPGKNQAEFNSPQQIVFKKLSSGAEGKHIISALCGGIQGMKNR